MLIKTVLNRLHRFKGFVYGAVSFATDGKEIEVEVKARKNYRPRCSACSGTGTHYGVCKTRRYRFVPLWGIQVFFVYAPRRIHCKRCDRVKVEHVPWARGKQRNTLHFQGFLSHWAKKLAWKQVAVEFGVHWNDVFRAVESVVTWGLKRRCLRGIKAIGVDELMIWKGHKYITVVYQIDQHCKRLLWLGRERTAESFNGFFDMLGNRRSRAIRFVCSDMWKAYLNVIAERTPKAVHILDRFHIVANLNKALDEVRAHEARRLTT